MPIQRIDASQLLNVIFTEEKAPHIKFILSDNPIFQKKIEDLIFEQTQQRPSFFNGKTALQDHIGYISSCGMFGAPQKSIVSLFEKWTQKQWDEEKKILTRLPEELEASTFFFTPVSFRNIVKETDFPKYTSFYLCYEPNDMEVLRCIEILFSRYKNSFQKNFSKKTEIAHLALETYSSDLISCDAHFERMEKGNFNFSEALAGSPQVNAFSVVDAVASGDAYLVELRMNQCADCGEEALSVFMALSYFLKQVAFVQAHLSETGNLRSAFDLAKIPFPGQKRIEKALKVLSTSQITSFFLAAAKIEMELRYQKHAHSYLSTEINLWLQNK